MGTEELLSVVAACPDGSPLRAAVNSTYDQRGLHRPAALPVLRAACNRSLVPRDEELIGLHRHGTPEQREQAAELVRREHGPRLRLFRGRLFLTAPVEQSQMADATLADALEAHVRIPVGTVDFQAHLYRELVRSLPLETVPEAVSSPPPSWFAALSQQEQRFVQVCQSLRRRSDRILVYLCSHARLDVARITFAVSGEVVWTEDRLARALETGLGTIFDAMA